MYCRNCGNKINENDKFCSHCGTPVTRPEPQPEKMEVKREPIDDMPFSAADLAELQRILQAAEMPDERASHKASAETIQMSGVSEEVKERPQAAPKKQQPPSASNHRSFQEMPVDDVPEVHVKEPQEAEPKASKYNQLKASFSEKINHAPWRKNKTTPAENLDKPTYQGDLGEEKEPIVKKGVGQLILAVVLLGAISGIVIGALAWLFIM